MFRELVRVLVIMLVHYVNFVRQDMRVQIVPVRIVLRMVLFLPIRRLLRLLHRVHVKRDGSWILQEVVPYVIIRIRISTEDRIVQRIIVVQIVIVFLLAIQMDCVLVVRDGRMMGWEEYVMCVTRIIKEQNVINVFRVSRERVVRLHQRV